MSQAVQLPPQPFVDRRSSDGDAPETDLASSVGVERRQFTNSYTELSPDASELAQAIDRYKLVHRRRFITYEEMLDVVKSLGYSK